MNKAIAERWAAALRSDKYRQGKGCLKQTADDGTVLHCCLGVLTELYQEETRHGTIDALVETEIPGQILYVRGSTYAFSGESQVLPSEVMGWAGMRTKYGGYQAVKDFTGSGGLSGDNDHGLSFNQIADIIETHWEDM